MTTTTCSNSLVPVYAVFTNAERLALAGFLAGYRGLLLLETPVHSGSYE
jgi:hypothetical protein